jgi:hypothetical protein
VQPLLALQETAVLKRCQWQAINNIHPACASAPVVDEGGDLNTIAQQKASFLQRDV